MFNQCVFIPKYCNHEGVKANSASGALNKWLKGRVPDGCVVHLLGIAFAIDCVLSNAHPKLLMN